MIASIEKWLNNSMLDNLNWSIILMIIVLVLSCYTGIKIIDMLFSENKNKKKNSLF
jgi:hypothetical protein